MRILITGASGLLGLNLALETTHRHTVFGTVNDHSLKTDAFTVIQTNLLAPGAVERLLERTQPEWVIHCAALANLDACEATRPRKQLNTDLPHTASMSQAERGCRTSPPIRIRWLQTIPKMICLTLRDLLRTKLTRAGSP
jgi:dTDP-4-dehydrorhamnose reductase